MITHHNYFAASSGLRFLLCAWSLGRDTPPSVKVALPPPGVYWACTEFSALGLGLVGREGLREESLLFTKLLP